MPLLSTPSPGLPAKNLTAHGSRAHLCHPQTGGSWGPSNWDKGHRQKLAVHRGYFGQGSSHSPGQEAEKPAREQSPQEQPPALLCSPLEQIQELTCPPTSTGMSCLRTYHLPGRQRTELSSLQEGPRDSASFSSTTGSNRKAAQHHQSGKHPSHLGREVSIQTVS